MQAFSLSLIKGRLGSNQDRWEIQTQPERKRARGPVFGAPRRTKTSNAAAVATDGVRPGSRPGPIRIGAHKELSHADNNAVFAVGNARRASASRQRGSKKGAADGHLLGPSISPGDGRRRANPCKGWPSATASGDFGLDKASLSDISRCPRDRRASAGLEPVATLPPRGAEKSAPPY
jgi:hypothetical protein